MTGIYPGVGRKRGALPGAWRGVFLRALAEVGGVRIAALRANVSHCTVYRERRCNAPFRLAWDRALIPHAALDVRCPWIEPFLDALASSGVVEDAAREAAVGTSTVYHAAALHPAFRARWLAARARARADLDTA